jgi:c(7)-type cytochrome triheme protein
MKRAVFLLIFLAALSAHALGGRARSPVVYPPQELPLSFSHSRHLERQPLACTACHTGATTSTRVGDDLMAPEATCTPCHAIDRAKPSARDCGLCHPGWDGVGQPARVVAPPARLRFSHRLHAERGASCQTCHGDLVADKVGLATRNQLPDMATCLTCHDGRQASARCASCHLADASGRVRTDFPDGKLVPSGGAGGEAHDESFLRRTHARAAQRDPASCMACHGENECMECHQSRVKPPDIHPGNYELTHAVDARRSAATCTSCHRAQSFCTSCHARSGVSADRRTSELAASRAAQPTAPQFHPPGFSSLPRGRDHHAFAAQRNLASCASCHREDFCMTCHSAAPGGPRANPHGRGFAGSAKCRAVERKNPRVCTRCHIAEVPACD